MAMGALQLGALVLLQFISTHTLVGASPAQLTLLPTAEYLALAVTVYVALAFARRHHGSLTAQQQQQGEPLASTTDALEDPTRRLSPERFEGQPKGSAWAAGAAAAAATTLRVVRFSKNGPPILSHALETFVVSALLALSLLPQVPSWKAAHRDSPREAYFYAGPATVLAFVLIGTPVAVAAVATAVLQVALEAVSLLLLRDGLCAGVRDLDFAHHATISAACTSLLLLPLLRLAHFAESRHEVISALSPSSALLLLVGVITKAVLYMALCASSTVLTPVLTVFPRNLLLLGTSSTSGLDLAYRQRLTQLALMYFAGTCGALWFAKESRAILPPSGGSKRGPTDNDKLDMAMDDMTVDPSFSDSGPLAATRGFRRGSPSQSDNPPSSSTLGLVSVVPLLLLALVPPLAALSPQDASLGGGGRNFSPSSSLYSSCQSLPRAVRPFVCPLFRPPLSSQTVDIVIAYYDEEVGQTERDIDEIRSSPYVASRQHRVVVYNKGPHSAEFLREKLALAPADEIVPLPNLGREGATYLSHILLHYNDTLASLAPNSLTDPPPVPAEHLTLPASHLRQRTLADMTYFLQGRLAWHHVLRPRLKQVEPETGFVNFGPNVKLAECATDALVGLHFPMIAQIWSMFRGQLCPPQSAQAGAWSGQFAVSRCRILANPYERYAYLSELLEAPEGHWVHDGWGPNDSGGPSNPIFGHSVERAWPIMFNCADGRIVEDCPDGEASPAKCHCFDG
ncbi:hypothetical protein JCM3774_002514 [Rhodotorula dairenensis]